MNALQLQAANNLSDVANPATARGNLGAAASGANGDITSLTAITSIAGPGAITISAGGTNQNVTLTPSGTGYTILNGQVGIGKTPTAGVALDVNGHIQSSGNMYANYFADAVGAAGMGAGYGGVTIGNARMYKFSSTEFASGAADVAFYRKEAGTVEVNSGVAGVYRDLITRYQFSSGTTPAVSSCGTGTPAVAGTDVAGKITTGGGTLTSCVLTFANAWTNQPSCWVNDESTTGIVTPNSVTTTTTMTVYATTLTGKVISYGCSAWR